LATIPPESREAEPLALTPAQAQLRKMVLDAVSSPHSKRNYAKALDDLVAFCASRPLSRSLLMEWRSGMESLSHSTINVRLSAVRKMVGEARRAGMIGQEEAASLTDIPNISQKGTRVGNWPSPTARPSRANATTSSWRCWSAAPSGATSWPSSTSRPSSNEKEGGSWPTLRARAVASACFGLCVEVER
jgi:hypothetical protein